MKILQDLKIIKGFTKKGKNIINYSIKKLDRKDINIKLTNKNPNIL